MNKSERYPSYAACIARALSGSRQPLSVDSLLAEVANDRPLGKGARSAVYRAIQKLFQAVPVSPGHYGWLSHLLSGAVFRHPLTSEETRRGYLLLDELEHTVFFPQFFQHYRPDDRVLTIELFGGPTIRAEAAIERKTWSLRLGQEFADWIDELGGQNRDDIQIIVKDALRGCYELRLKLREIRDERAIEQRNIQMALLAEELVAEDRRTRSAIPTWELVARLIGRGFFADPIPPDDLHYVLHEYSMLRLSDGIGYQLDTGAPVRDMTRRFGSASAQVPLSGSFTEWQYRDSGPGLSPYDQIESGDSMLDYEGDLGEEDGACPAYEQYLADFYASRPFAEPLEHEDFHLLEAELEMLVQLEQEFGRLLPEQSRRKNELAQRLFIDPDTLLDMGWDAPDDPGAEEPPFWEN
ncbi:MAG: hypothetical protein QM346_11605 [Chloroflexota bacterium]|nr:hypothetical protein [Chloroflexota bacterium]